jgi:hypothetical protein
LLGSSGLCVWAEWEEVKTVQGCSQPWPDGELSNVFDQLGRVLVTNKAQYLGTLNNQTLQQGLPAHPHELLGYQAHGNEGPAKHGANHPGPDL